MFGRLLTETLMEVTYEKVGEEQGRLRKKKSMYGPDICN